MRRGVGLLYAGTMGDDLAPSVTGPIQMDGVDVGAERVRSWVPADEVSRMLLFEAILFLVAFGAILRVLHLLEHPEIEPYTSPAGLRLAGGFAAGMVVRGLLVALIGLRLRTPSRARHLFVRAVTLTWWLALCCFVYLNGPSTFPGWLLVPLFAMMCLLGFDEVTAISGFVLAIVILWTLAVLERLDYIPYAPLLATMPLVNGRVANEWLWSNMVWPTLVSCVGFAPCVYLVRRSRAETLRIAQLSDLLKRMFGRYMSNEVMQVLLADPDAFELGGERRKVTIMFTDLRGFATFAERLAPEAVLATLNDYFAEMIDVCIRYGGTINEIMGDALLVTFGAPIERPDHAGAATACAIEMQNAMVRVNAQNREEGRPELEMGIGLHTAVVVVGNLGSAQRTTYGVVGSGVNLASRIESYTVGGQVLASQSLVDEVGPALRIDGQREVTPKGSQTPVTVYDVGGIGGDYNVVLESTEQPLRQPPRTLRLAYRRLSGKHVTGARAVVDVTGLGPTGLEVAALSGVALLDNVEMSLPEASPQLQTVNFYGKVLVCNGDGRCHVRFTAVPSEVLAYFEGLLAGGA